MSWCECGNHGPENYQDARAANACHVCWIQRWHPGAMPPLSRPKPPPKASSVSDRLKTPCVHRSAEPVRSEGCATCRGRVEVKVFGCARHGECAAAPNRVGLRDCIGCDDYEAPVAWPIKFDHRNLAVGKKGMRFNASLIDWQGAYLLAYRDGWKGSRIWTIPLDRSFRPSGEPVMANMQMIVNRRKSWRCPGVQYGQEDPRLFWARGQLHLAFIGVEGRRSIIRTNQCFARFRDDRTVDDAWQVNVRDRRDWEKNFTFFAYNDEIYAVYLTHPHHIVIRVECSRATVIHDEPNPFPWTGGEIRGGPSPILVGDEFLAFPHDRIDVDGLSTYRVLAYTFDAKPPFAPRRMMREPLMIADASTKPPDQYCACLFVCGAVKSGDDIVLSMGVHDRHTSLEKFKWSDIDKRLSESAH